MKVEIEVTPMYNLKLNGETVAPMEVESRWEGFTKLVNRDGETLIVAGLQDNRGIRFSQAFVDIFGDVFGARRMEASPGVKVIAGSPRLLALLMEPTA